MSPTSHLWMTAFVGLLCWLGGCLSTENQRFGCDFAPPEGDTCRCAPIRAQTSVSRDAELLPRLGGQLSIRLPSEPVTLLSAIEPSLWNEQIVDHDVLETLVRHSPSTGQYEPELSSSFAVSPDGLTYTFHLRRNTRWHDGEPFSADDVVYTLQALADPTQVFARRSQFIGVETAQAIEEDQVAITLSAPDSGFIAAISRLPILPKHVFARTRIISNPKARAPIGTGPFRVRRWIPGKQIELERSPTWNSAPPLLETVVYHFIPDDRVAGRMLQREELDIVLSPSPSLVVQGAPRRIETYNLPVFDHWIYNTRNPAFAEATVRRALGHAIDRDGVRCAIYRCRAAPITHLWFSEQQDQLPHRYTLGYDPQKSIRLLDHAGWRDADGDGTREKGGLKLSFTLTVADEDRATARAAASIQYDLQQVGVSMRIRMLSKGAFWERLQGGAFDAAIVSLYSDQQTDPWKLHHTDAVTYGVNFGAFSHPEVDWLLGAFDDQVRVSGAKELLDQLEVVLAEQHPWTPLLRRSQIAILGPRVRGWTVDGGHLDVRYLWLDEPQPKPRGR